MQLSAETTDGLARFARKWGVSRLWLFGSVAKGTERAESDVDVLAEFLPDSKTSTWDWPEMKDELRSIFGREVDLASTGILRNPFRRQSILSHRRLLYAA